uniref:Uncharacterized protein n=1 Tax=Cacopsylla melanoneura TaxID=428564 RepID=A0A8D8WDD6_9HEMI
MSYPKIAGTFFFQPIIQYIHLYIIVVHNMGFRPLYLSLSLMYLFVCCFVCYASLGPFPLFICLFLVFFPPPIPSSLPISSSSYLNSSLFLLLLLLLPLLLFLLVPLPLCIRHIIGKRSTVGRISCRLKF